MHGHEYIPQPCARVDKPEEKRKHTHTNIHRRTHKHVTQQDKKSQTLRKRQHNTKKAWQVLYGVSMTSI